MDLKPAREGGMSDKGAMASWASRAVGYIGHGRSPSDREIPEAIHADPDHATNTAKHPDPHDLHPPKDRPRGHPRRPRRRNPAPGEAATRRHVHGSRRQDRLARVLRGARARACLATPSPSPAQVIPEPRCLNGIRANIDKNRYKDPLDAYTDLSLVFWNALFYNEPGSQIASDAQTLQVSHPRPSLPKHIILILKNILVAEWQKRSVLPSPRLSPPPASPQKVHGVLASAQPKPEPTPDMDIDVSATPDPDIDNDDTEEPGTGDGDGDGEAIVSQLEKTLPHWDGFADAGWMSEAPMVSSLVSFALVMIVVAQDRLLQLVMAIKSHKDLLYVPMLSHLPLRDTPPAEIASPWPSKPSQRNPLLPFCLIRQVPHVFSFQPRSTPQSLRCP